LKLINTSLDDEDDVYDFEEEINVALLNTLTDKYTTPRYPVYIKDKDVLEVCLTGADTIIYDDNLSDIIISFKTCKKPDVKRIDKSLLVKLLDMIQNPKVSETKEEQLIKEFRVTSRKKRLTDKQTQEILKYEERRKGNWK